MKFFPWTVFSAIVLSGFALATVGRMYYSSGTFILCYHKIAPFRRGGLKSLFVRPGYFKAQMAYLKMRGYRAVSLTELSRILSSGEKIPPKIFVITFDDGYRDNFTSAYPVLKKYGFTATVFLTASSVGKTAGYPGEAATEHLSVSDIKEMSSGGIEFGAHTVHHPRLAEISAEEAAAEISGSKKMIKELTGLTPVSFCYPFGSYNAAVAEIVRKEYAAACTTRGGLVKAGADPHLLPRVEFKDLFTMSFRDFFKAAGFYAKILLGA